jgi:hypothetical protein
MSYRTFKSFNDEEYEQQILGHLRYDIISSQQRNAFADWILTDKGEYANKHFKHVQCKAPSMMIGPNTCQVSVIGYCKPEDWTFWTLKWSA